MFGRFFLAMIMALALTLGPLAMPAGKATAAAAHHGEMATTDHCDQQPQPDRQDRADKDCCVAGCTAVAVLLVPALESAALPGLRERPAPDHFRLGYLGEIATPPPRFA